MRSSLSAGGRPSLYERDTFAARPTTSTQGVLHPQEADRHIDLRRYPAAPAVDRYVERYWAVHWDLPAPQPYQVELLPHPCVNLTFTPEAGAVVHGVGTSRSVHPLAGTGRVFGVKFRPGGFAAATGVVASTLTDRSVPLRDLVGGEAQLARQVLAAANDRQRVALCDSFLSQLFDNRATGTDPGYQAVVKIITRMLNDRTITRVDQAAREHHRSVRSLQRLFHRYVGVGPKWVIRRYRMHDGAERLASVPGVDPGQLAVELGWFDQAHFTRDFSALTGMSPAEYAATAQLTAARTSSETSKLA